MRRQDIFVVIGASMASAAAASAVTWFLGVKKVEKEYEERLDYEVKESVAHLLEEKVDHDPTASEEIDEEDVELPFEDDESDDVERVFPDRGKMDLDELKNRNNVTQYHQIVKTEEYSSDEPEVIEPPVVGETSWDPGDEDISVISRDIFMENLSEFEQSTLTWFQDEAVVDLDSELVHDHELLIGSGRPPFGQMSEDENIVYIRNHKIKMEYEVIQDPGKATDFLMHSLFDAFNHDVR